MKPWGIMVTAGCRGRVLPRQRGADGEEGRSSERREYRFCLPFVLVRALQVDRDRHRAAPVRARCRVLREADRVATVAIHRAAAGGIIEGAWKQWPTHMMLMGRGLGKVHFHAFTGVAIN